MNLPRYWARATADTPDSQLADIHHTEAFGWSDVSVADAERDASERAKRVGAWLAGDRATDLDRYGYGSDRPVREEVVREFGTGSERFAAITRNRYGALVLNTASVAFIDVDLPSPVGFWARLFGRKNRAAEAILSEIRTAIDGTKGLSARIYRTAGGFRCLATSGLFDPAAQATAELMARFGADPRYRQLCRVQRCFRARLTPKPWRCGLADPHIAWPFADSAHETAYREWLRRYIEVTRDRAVCELIEARGPAGVHPQAAMVVREHDNATCRPGAALA